MIEEILLRSRLDDTRRLYEIISEQKSTLQERLSAAGHQTAVGQGPLLILPSLTATVMR